jgi:RimJ/RimL family protein N-acetyltransferase
MTKSKAIEGLEIRFTEESDETFMRDWFRNEEVRRWFPMKEEAEIDDSVKRWVGFYKFKCSLTAVKNGVPCGISTLYLQPYRQLAHQCEFGIVMNNDYRGQGIGTILLNSLIHMAKNRFRIELIHLQVYEGNPAIGLYKKFGFQEFGRQDHWLKKGPGQYDGRIFMEKYLHDIHQDIKKYGGDLAADTENY